MTRPALTYFSSRGLAEPIRVVLAVAGVDYEDRGFDAHPDLLATLKASGVLAFGSVPLWEEPDGFRLVQSDAILRYLAAAHGLAGGTPREAAHIEMVREGVKDVRGQLMRVRMAEEGQRAAIRAELANEMLPRWLGHFERLLGGNDFFVGHSLTLADLSVWLLLEALRDNGLASLAELPGLSAFATRVEAIPALAAWIASPRRYPVQLLPT